MSSGGLKTVAGFARHWQWQASSRSFFLFICARVRPSFLARQPHSSSHVAPSSPPRSSLALLCDIFMLQHAQFTSAKSADSCLQTGNSNREPGLSFGQGGTFNDRNGFLSCCPQTLSSRTHTHTQPPRVSGTVGAHTHVHSPVFVHLKSY